MHARITAKLAFWKRSAAVPIVRPGNAYPVFCDRNPDRKPLIAKRYQELAGQICYGALMLFLILACAMLGGLQ